MNSFDIYTHGASLAIIGSGVGISVLLQKYSDIVLDLIERSLPKQESMNRLELTHDSSLIQPSPMVLSD